MRDGGRMGLLLYDSLKDIPDLRIYGPPPGADGYLFRIYLVYLRIPAYVAYLCIVEYFI